MPPRKKNRVPLRILALLTLVWAGWAVWNAFSVSGPIELRVIDDHGNPVPGATVDIEGSEVGTTDGEGIVTLNWSGPSQQYRVVAAGYVPTRVGVPDSANDPTEVVVRAEMLRGVVADPDGKGVPGAYLRSGDQVARTDSAGVFNLRRAQPGNVEVYRPGWERTSFDWSGSPGQENLTISPQVIKAVHVDWEAAGTRYDEFIEMTESTELNGIMLDLKDESGLIFYRTEVEAAHRAGAVSAVYDLADLVARTREADLYLIGRITAFQDPLAARAIPEMAAWDTATDAPLRSGHQYFLDPSNDDARQYALDLAVEACGMGVDEIQFDYVRYPDYRPESVEFDGPLDAASREQTVNSFLEEAVALLHPMGCVVAADIFGFVTTISDPPDGGIGQNWETVTQIVDVVSPMVYPSHYTRGWFNFEVPNDHPGPVVERALADGFERIDHSVVVRPWLQDFSYTPQQVREQIDAVARWDLGWMLWNPTSRVSLDAIGSE